jgi:hypothetical protein
VGVLQRERDRERGVLEREKEREREREREKEREREIERGIRERDDAAWRCCVFAQCSCYCEKSRQSFTQGA